MEKHIEQMAFSSTSNIYIFIFQKVWLNEALSSKSADTFGA